MLSLILLSLVLAGNIALAFISPILLPINLLDDIKELIITLNVFDSLVPIVLCIKLIYWTFTIIVTKWTVRFVIGLIAMASGGGKPEI